MNSGHSKKINLIWYGIAFAVPVILTAVFYKIDGCVPFGERALTTNDASIQYLDFFMYLKDIMSGENSILYSFSKSLGGTSIGFFDVHLASPLNLLLVFFEKEQVIVFFQLLVALKFGLISLFMFFYLVHRFDGIADFKTENMIIAVLLSLCYAFCQYTAAQCDNIHFIDGVYMLPLLSYFIYKTVNGSRGIWLSFFVGIMIILGWYTAGMNCVFSVVCFVTELAIYYYNNHGEIIFKTIDKSLILNKTKTYLVHMVLGVLLSAAVFLPVIISITNCPKIPLDLKGLLNPFFNGNVVNAVEGYVIGAQSTEGFVALYCGGIALVGTIAFFSNRRIDKTYRVIAGISFAVLLLSYYWKWLYRIFSLGKPVWSYAYRHSYMSIFLMIVIAAVGLFKIERNDLKKIARIIAVFIVVQFAFSMVSGRNSIAKLLLTAIFIVAECCVLYFAVDKKSVHGKKIALLLLCCLTVADVCCELYFTSERISMAERSDYIKKQADTIDSLKARDRSFYRISQISPLGAVGIRANYNEGLAYNYPSISGYTSLAEGNTLSFLEKCGYRIQDNNMNIVNTSMLGVDSLLGVKYLLSNHYIDGYQTTDIEDVYYNPYALPEAFIPEGREFETIRYNGNPFEYQNEIYSQLLGEETEIYSPVSFRRVSEDTVTYEVSSKTGSYGNLPWDSTYNGKIYIDGNYATDYSRFLSPSVFYIPSGEEQETHVIEVRLDDTDSFNVEEEQFYCTDFSALEKAKTKLDNNQAEVITWENGHLCLSVSSEEDAKLFVGIPYEKGWNVTVNGVRVEAEVFADCFYLVPISQGDNNIEFTYHCRGMSLGILITVLTAAYLIMEPCFKKEKKQGIR